MVPGQMLYFRLAFCSPDFSISQQNVNFEAPFMSAFDWRVESTVSLSKVLREVLAYTCQKGKTNQDFCYHLLWDETEWSWLFFNSFVNCNLIGLLDLTETWTWTFHLEVSICFYSKPVDLTFLDPTEHVRWNLTLCRLLFLLSFV